VWCATRGLDGSDFEYRVYGRPRFINNAWWLNDSHDAIWGRSAQHPLQLVLFLLGLPLAYLVFQKQIPLKLRMTRVPVALLFAGLMLVGNVYEPRIFGEIVIALYIPVVVGAVAWVRREAPGATPSGVSRLLVAVDRFPWGTAVFVGWWTVGTLCFHYPRLAAVFGDTTIKPQ
jgi:hypothetical protein